MRIVRYITQEGAYQLTAVTDEGHLFHLPQSDFLELVRVAREAGVDALTWVQDWTEGSDPIGKRLNELQLAVPIDAPEVWACGVTYEKSRDARNYEATDGKLDATTFYDKVYDAERPEIFFKSTAARTIGPGMPVYLRSDSRWQIPEPELALVLDQEGRILGYTIGNDMSCRDIEGENPLYLPQAKMWRHSCAIGPAIRLAETVEDPYQFQIECRIYRNDEKVVEGRASTGQLKRKLEELVSYLKRDNIIFDGTVLFTGTCIVPPDYFTLSPGDRIEIHIPSIGTLTNLVQRQL